MECSKCGVAASKVKLLEAISPKGIIKICEACFKEEDLPLLMKPTTFQLKEAEKEQGFYRKSVREFSNLPKKDEEKEKVETTLKDIVDKQYELEHKREAKPRPDLVDNFHWIIMRARRLKKITQKDLAKEISESEAAIKMAEQGILPEDDYRLVNKLEGFLGIKIIKDEMGMVPKEEPARVIKFDPEVTKELTIADLKRMREGTEEESEILEEVEEPENETEEEPETETEEEEGEEEDFPLNL